LKNKARKFSKKRVDKKSQKRNYSYLLNFLITPTPKKAPMVTKIEWNEQNFLFFST